MLCEVKSLSHAFTDEFIWENDGQARATVTVFSGKECENQERKEIFLNFKNGCVVEMRPVKATN